MAIIVPDQGNVDLKADRGSRIQVADLYARPITRDVGRGAAEVAKALSAMGSNLSAIGEDQMQKDIAEQAKQKDLYVAQVQAAISQGKPTADAINNVTSPLYPKVQSLVSQTVGDSQGQSWISQRLEAIPRDVALDPVKSKAYLDSVRQEALQLAGGTPFYSAGYMGSVQNGIAAKEQQLAAMRSGETTKVLEEGFRSKVGGGVRAILGGQTPSDMPTAGRGVEPGPVRPLNPKAQSFATPENREALVATAKRLGLNPVDLATVISYESAGSFDPWKKGPTTKWGEHRGLIQFGEPQRKQFGVYEGQSFAEQMVSVEKYLRASGFKEGMGRKELYATILAGDPAKGDISDGYGTANQHLTRMAQHQANAQAFLGTFELKGQDNQVAQNADGRVQVADASGTVPIPSSSPAVRQGDAGPTATPKSLPQEAVKDTGYRVGVGESVGRYDDLKDLDPKYETARRYFFGKDEEFDAFSSIEKSRLRDTAWDETVAVALENRDANALRIVPDRMLTPEQRVQRNTIGKKIEEIKLHEGRQKSALLDAQRKEYDRVLKISINERLMKGDLSPQERAKLAKEDPEVFDYMLKQEKHQLSVDPYTSQREAAIFERDAFDAASTGDWTVLRRYAEINRVMEKGGKPTIDDVQKAIDNAPLRTEEKIALTKGLKKTFEGAMIAQRPEVQTEYNNRVKPVIDAQMATLPLQLQKQFTDTGIDLAAQTRKAYDTEVRQKVMQEMQKSGAVSADRLGEITEGAITKALQTRKEIMDTVKGFKPEQKEAAVPESGGGDTKKTSSSSKPASGYVKVTSPDGKSIEWVPESQAEAARAEMAKKASSSTTTITIPNSIGNALGGAFGIGP